MPWLNQLLFTDTKVTLPTHPLLSPAKNEPSTPPKNRVVRIYHSPSATAPRAPLIIIAVAATLPQALLAPNIPAAPSASSDTTVASSSDSDVVVSVVVLPVTALSLAEVVVAIGARVPVEVVVAAGNEGEIVSTGTSPVGANVGLGVCSNDVTQQ